MNHQKYFIENWGLSMNKVLLLCSLLLVSSFSYGDISFGDLSKLSSAPEYLEGKFSQDKYLRELDAHLESSGKFDYQRGKSIQWETIEPIQNILLMTPQSITNSQGEDEIVRLQADSNPAVAILSDIFFSVLTADWPQLAAYFTLSGTVEGEHWQVELVPSDKAVMQVVERVKLTGDTFLRELIFFEKNGDQTTITFSDLSQ